jgi:hypothetical protein
MLAVLMVLLLLALYVGVVSVKLMLVCGVDWVMHGVRAGQHLCHPQLAA